ncbi:MAG: DUF342 domain-containing protein [Cellulosilyticaceae bacterium]
MNLGDIQKIDEKVVVEITPDKMIGVISFEEPGVDGQRLDEKAIRHAIEKREICFGIDEALLNEILSSRRYNYKYIIAKGTPPVKGEDAKLEYSFDPKTINVFKPAQNLDGTVNFKDMNVVHNVTRNAVLVVKAEATEGTPGTNVLGQEIKAQKGKDVRIPKGKNTKLLEDGLTLVAEISGKLSYDHHNVYISPTFIVEKDVDSSTGNIDFVGNVVVNGNVQNGFKVKAGGTVEIKGCVEAAEIEAGDDVVVWYGIQGMDKGIIRTKGNLVAKFIQNAYVEADGEVVTEAIMHSHIAAASIDVAKGKGLIVGGEMIAGRQIHANIMGSPMATQTIVQIGVPPNLLKEYQQVEKLYQEVREEVTKVSQSVTFLMGKKDIIGEQKQTLLSKLITTKVGIEARHREVAEKHKMLSDKIKEANTGLVKVKNKLYPGVKITIGTAVKYISEDYTYCTIQKEGADVVLLPY